MHKEIHEQVEMGSNVEIIGSHDYGSVYRVAGHGGDGIMKWYAVYPGIYAMFNEYHALSCESEVKPQLDMIVVDHCLSGRSEWHSRDGSLKFIESGDMQIDLRTDHLTRCNFPTGHYKGVSIAFCIEEAKDTVHGLIQGVPIDLREIWCKLNLYKSNCVYRNHECIQRLFYELYMVPENLRFHYLKIKVIELLLFLSRIELCNCCRSQVNFSKCQMDAVKEAKALITTDLEQHYTIEQLAAKLDISATTLKQTFKATYGETIYNYRKQRCMARAAWLLKETTLSVTEIAGKSGYTNPSKFSTAFKAIYGVTPIAYRNTCPDGVNYI